jgi:hypothetical protein
MKNLIMLLIVPFMMNGQETEKPATTTTTTTTVSTTISSETNKPSIFTKKHEIKIGAIKMLAGPIFEGTYEHIYSKDFTFGSSILCSLSSKDYYDEEFSITPFARFYFQETKEYGAYGFFFEGFAKYFSGKYNKYNSSGYGTMIIQKTNGAAIGISLGKKWVNSSGFVFEILGGVGRTLGSDENQPAAIFRGDLNVGYRF